MSFSSRIEAGARRIPIPALYALAFLPGALVFYRVLGDSVPFADPLLVLHHHLGEWALRLIILTLALSPLRRYLGINLLIWRRMLGLSAFWYAVTHLSVWVVLDKGFIVPAILEDIWRRPYILFGMTGFLLLVPLAITSNGFSIRRLGAAGWNRLHQLVYPAAILVVLHYLWLVKSWTAEPLIYAAIVAFELSLRYEKFAKRKRKPRRAAS